jgi:hypothetical protein
MSELAQAPGLLVDDSSAGQTHLRALPRQTDHAVEISGSSEEGIARFVPVRFQIAFLDIRGLVEIPFGETLYSVAGPCRTMVI